MKLARQAAVFLFLGITVIGWSLPLHANAQNARLIAQQVLPSVVMILVQDGNWQPLAQGSGFLVETGVVATNLHVIEGATHGSVKFAGDDALHEIAGIIAIDQARDLALLSVPSAAGLPLKIANSDGVAVGERIYAVGNPLGLEGTISEGIVSGLRQLGGDTLFQITAPISPGSSGGPILNSSGAVIGVASAFLQGGQNLNFAIPSRFLVSLISQPTSITTLAELVPRPQSMRGQISRTVIEGVTIAAVEFRVDECVFSYSIRNSLPTAIRNVSVLTVFYATDGLPMNAVTSNWVGTVMPGLAARQDRVSTDCGTLRFARTPLSPGVRELHRQFAIIPGGGAQRLTGIGWNFGFLGLNWSGNSTGSYSGELT